MMSLRLYTGEYLKSPVPVHFGLNWCTHSCFYCFANLNKPGRRADNNDMTKMAKWFARDKGPIEYWYLKNGHPLLVANDSDPLARSNADSFDTLRDLCTDLGVRIVYQTKGGATKDEDRAIAGRPTMFYVSVTSDRDDFLKKSEAGAPGFLHRVDLIRRAREAGHHVVVGLNPFVPAWWDDIAGSLDKLREAGAAHIWAGKLHLSRLQLAEMPKGHLERFAEWNAYGMKRKKADAPEFAAAIQYAHSIGFNCFDGQTGSSPDFWKPYFDLGIPYMPTVDGVFSTLLRYGKGKPVAITLDDFNALTRIPGVPEDLSIYDSYLMSFGRSLRNDGRKIRARTFADVHEAYWDWLNYPTPLVLNDFKVATEGSGDDESMVTDDFGIPVMVFEPGSDPDSATLPVEKAIRYSVS